MVYGERANPVLPCGPAIPSLVLAAVEWFFSLPFRTGNDHSNLLDRKGFQAVENARSPCIRENHPANRESQGDHGSALEGAAPHAASPRRTRTAADEKRQPKNRKCNARSCFADTSDGAPIIRSSATLVQAGTAPPLAGSLLAARQHDDAGRCQDRRDLKTDAPVRTSVGGEGARRPTTPVAIATVTSFICKCKAQRTRVGCFVTRSMAANGLWA
jgi:hypothetical protein